jgi:hypothetical protein
LNIQGKMRHLTKCGLILLLALTGCQAPSPTAPTPSAVQTPDFIPTKSVPDFSTDEGPGEYTVGYSTDLSGFNAVSLSFILDKTRVDPKWTPECGLRLRDVGDLKGDGLDYTNELHALMVRLTNAGAANLFVGEIERSRPGVPTYPLKKIVKVGEKVNILVSWNGNSAFFWVNGEFKGNIPYKSPIRFLAIIGSTGECHFSSINLGSMK